MHDDVWDRQELLFKIKLLKDRVEAFESGEKFVRMEALHKIAREGDFRTINRLKKELSVERAEKTHVRELWYQTCLDLQNEYEKKLREKDKECAEKLAEKDRIILLLQKDLQEERARREEEHGKYLKQVKEAYEAKTQLEEEKEKNQDLTSRIHKDYSNSSKSSSMSPNHETIHNSREKSGLNPGGQPGHIHHGRKRQEPTESHEIPAPDQYLEEGNSSDQVKKNTYNRSSSYIAGYGHPLYSDTDGATAAPIPSPAPEPALKTCDVKAPLLKRGNTGSAVKNAQTLLISKGYACGGAFFGGREIADGDFGPTTEKSVKSFQDKHKLSADGIIGSETWKALLTE